MAPKRPAKETPSTLTVPGPAPKKQQVHFEKSRTHQVQNDAAKPPAPESIPKRRKTYYEAFKEHNDALAVLSIESVGLRGTPIAIDPDLFSRVKWHIFEFHDWFDHEDYDHKYAAIRLYETLDRNYFIILEAGPEAEDGSESESEEALVEKKNVQSKETVKGVKATDVASPRMIVSCSKSFSSKIEAFEKHASFLDERMDTDDLAEAQKVLTQQIATTERAALFPRSAHATSSKHLPPLTNPQVTKKQVPVKGKPESRSTSSSSAVPSKRAPSTNLDGSSDYPDDEIELYSHNEKALSMNTIQRLDPHMRSDIEHIDVPTSLEECLRVGARIESNAKIAYGRYHDSIQEGALVSSRKSIYWASWTPYKPLVNGELRALQYPWQCADPLYVAALYDDTISNHMTPIVKSPLFGTRADAFWHLDEIVAEAAAARMSNLSYDSNEDNAENNDLGIGEHVRRDDDNVPDLDADNGSTSNASDDESDFDITSTVTNFSSDSEADDDSTYESEFESENDDGDDVNGSRFISSKMYNSGGVITWRWIDAVNGRDEVGTAKPGDASSWTAYHPAVNTVELQEEGATVEDSSMSPTAVTFDGADDTLERKATKNESTPAEQGNMSVEQGERERGRYNTPRSLRSLSKPKPGSSGRGSSNRSGNQEIASDEENMHIVELEKRILMYASYIYGKAPEPPPNSDIKMPPWVYTLTYQAPSTSGIHRLHLFRSSHTSKPPGSQEKPFKEEFGGNSKLATYKRMSANYGLIAKPIMKLEECEDDIMTHLRDMWSETDAGLFLMADDNTSSNHSARIFMDQGGSPRLIYEVVSTVSVLQAMKECEENLSDKSKHPELKKAMVAKLGGMGKGKERQSIRSSNPTQRGDNPSMVVTFDGSNDRQFTQKRKATGSGDSTNPAAKRNPTTEGREQKGSRDATPLPLSSSSKAVPPRNLESSGKTSNNDSSNKPILSSEDSKRIAEYDKSICEYAAIVHGKSYTQLSGLLNTTINYTYRTVYGPPGPSGIGRISVYQSDPTKLKDTLMQETFGENGELATYAKGALAYKKMAENKQDEDAAAELWRNSRRAAASQQTIVDGKLGTFRNHNTSKHGRQNVEIPFIRPSTQAVKKQILATAEKAWGTWQKTYCIEVTKPAGCVDAPYTAELYEGPGDEHSMLDGVGATPFKALQAMNDLVKKIQVHTEGILKQGIRLSGTTEDTYEWQIVHRRRVHGSIPRGYYRIDLLAGGKSVMDLEHRDPVQVYKELEDLLTHEKLHDVNRREIRSRLGLEEKPLAPGSK